MNDATEETNATSGNNGDVLNKLRFDYSWKWFEFHARQRVTMFNFFLLAVGILGKAYVDLLDAGDYWLAVGLASASALISMIFFGLDVRNRNLVHIGEAHLKRLESDDLFNGWGDGKEGDYPEGPVKEADKYKGLLRHTPLLRSIEGLVVVAYLFAAVHAWCEGADSERVVAIVHPPSIEAHCRVCCAGLPAATACQRTSAAVVPDAESPASGQEPPRPAPAPSSAPTSAPTSTPTTID